MHKFFVVPDRWGSKKWRMSRIFMELQPEFSSQTSRPLPAEFGQKDFFHLPLDKCVFWGYNICGCNTRQAQLFLFPGVNKNTGEKMHQIFSNLKRYIKKTEGCWIWMGQKNQRGYGILSDDEGYAQLVTRLIYVAVEGNLPSHMIVKHTCHNSPCVRPEHLFIEPDPRHTSVPVVKHAIPSQPKSKPFLPRPMCPQGHSGRMWQPPDRSERICLTCVDEGYVVDRRGYDHYTSFGRAVGSHRITYPR